MERFRGLLTLFNTKTILISSFLIFNLCFIYSNYNIGYNIYDDGIAAFGASRVLHGEMPYRDFWTCYAPGNFYLEALLFRAFGENLLVQRVYGGVVVFLFPLIVWFLTKKVMKWQYALAVAALIALSFGFCGPVYGMAFTTAGLFYLLSVNVIIGPGFVIRKNNLFVAGILAGCTILFKHEFGLAAAIATIAYLFIEDPKNGLSRNKIYILGMICFVLPAGLYFMWNVPIKELLDQFVRFPLEIFPDFRRLPFPAFNISFDAFPFYYPVLVFILTVVVQSRKALRDRLKNISSTDKISLMFMALGMMLFLESKTRADNAHMFLTVAVCVILSVFLSASALEEPDIFLQCAAVLILIANVTLGISFLKYGAEGFYRPFFNVPIFILFITALIMAVRVSWQGKKSIPYIWIVPAVLVVVTLCAFNIKTSSLLPTFGTPEGFCGSLFPQAKGIVVPFGAEKNMYLTVNYLESQTPKTQKLFIGSMRHDILSVNNVLIYFFAGYNCATRYHELHPGVVTTLEAQSEIIRELQQQKDTKIVLKENPLISEPNESSVSSGVRVLDEFIRQNYDVECPFGPYYILIEKHTKA